MKIRRGPPLGLAVTVGYERIASMTRQDTVLDMAMTGRNLKRIMQDIEKRLEELRNAGEIDERTRHTIIDLSNKVLENIAQKYDNVKKGVHDIMGGQVLEYETKTIWNGGKQEKAKEMAFELFHEGVSLDVIARAAKESVSTIQEWLNEDDD